MLAPQPLDLALRTGHPQHLGLRLDEPPELAVLGRLAGEDRRPLGPPLEVPRRGLQLLVARQRSGRRSCPDLAALAAAGAQERAALAPVGMRGELAPQKVQASATCCS